MAYIANEIIWLWRQGRRGYINVKGALLRCAAFFVVCAIDTSNEGDLCVAIKRLSDVIHAKIIGDDVGVSNLKNLKVLKNPF